MTSAVALRHAEPATFEPPCGGRLKFGEIVTETDRAHALLEELALPADPPPRALARSPTFDEGQPPDDW